ncbi:alpha/beta hydrolase [Streptomyces sp. NPDC006458]|uniref:alpha/beta hydrolase n=1 Tax=Streptomyces sp. NPDC006458 TaxID=3154302 RepID=UPI0033AFF268
MAGVGVDRVLLVAPPSRSFVVRQPEIAEFALPDLDLALPSPTRFVAGDDDPCCPEGARAEYAEPLRSPVDILPGAGHLSVDDGYGPWPAVLEWCLGPREPLVARGATPTR